MWFQLTYASVEKNADRPGGWGVAAASPNLPPDVRDRLLAGVVNRIDELVPTDEFAKRHELDARVRCFSYKPDVQGGTWWHAVVAGKDATGRPGNVFTHALTVTELEPGLRPVDLWGSKEWLMPFGATEVAAARLPASVEREPAALSGPEFALRQPRAAVEAVLAAVISCFQNSQPLVLAADSQGTFIDWLRAVSYLTSATVAAQIPFSTFVRAATLPAWGRQFEILGIPREDLAAVLASSVGASAPLVMDLADLPQSQIGESWEYAGQRWNGGERWQDAYFVLTDGAQGSVTELVASMDGITENVTPQDHLSPEWPLALALLRRDGAAHSDIDVITSEWRLLRPYDGLTDPVLVELLNVPVEEIDPLDEDDTAAEPPLEEPIEPAGAEVAQVLPEEQPALETQPPPEDQPDSEAQPTKLDARSTEREVPLRDLLARVEDQNETVASLLEVIGTSRTGIAWMELPSAVTFAAEGQAVWARGPAPGSLDVKMLLEWLQVAPLLAVLENAVGEERQFVGDAILLAMGVARLGVAAPSHQVRVEHLLTDSARRPPSLVRLLEAWQEAYQAMLGDQSIEGSVE